MCVCVCAFSSSIIIYPVIICNYLVSYNGSQQLAYNMEAPFSRAVGLRAESLWLCLLCFILRQYNWKPTGLSSPSLLGPFRPGQIYGDSQVSQVLVACLEKNQSQSSQQIHPNEGSRNNHRKPLDPETTGYQGYHDMPEVGTTPHFEPPSEHWTEVPLR